MKRFLAKGFVLIELLIVLPILVLLLSLSLQRKSFLNKSVLDSEVRLLRLVFVYLQQKAIMLGMQQRLVFLPEQNSYYYKRGNKKVSYGLPKQIGFGFIPGSKGPPSRKSKPLKNNITFHKKTVNFHPGGYISPGAVYLVDREKSIMRSISVSILKESLASVN